MTIAQGDATQGVPAVPSSPVLLPSPSLVSAVIRSGRHRKGAAIEDGCVGWVCILRAVGRQPLNRNVDARSEQYEYTMHSSHGTCTSCQECLTAPGHVLGSDSGHLEACRPVSDARSRDLPIHTTPARLPLLFPPFFRQVTVDFSAPQDGVWTQYCLFGLFLHGWRQVAGKGFLQHRTVLYV